MTSAPEELSHQLPLALDETVIPGLGPPMQRGCEDRYDLGQYELLVVTDRACAAGRMLDTVPFKGEVSVRVGTWWLDSLGDLLTSPVQDIIDPQAMVVRATSRLPMRVGVYGHLCGRLWKEYRAGVRDFDGHRLTEGLAQGAGLPEPVILLLAIDAPEWTGELHSREGLIEDTSATAEQIEHACDVARRLFSRGQGLACERGVVLGSTVYDLGTLADGTLVARDLLHAPHLSSYWRETADGRVPLSEPGVLAEWVTAGGTGDLNTDQRLALARSYLELGQRFVADFTPIKGPVANRLTLSLSHVGLVG